MLPRTDVSASASTDLRGEQELDRAGGGSAPYRGGLGVVVRRGGVEEANAGLVRRVDGRESRSRRRLVRPAVSRRGRSGVDGTCRRSEVRARGLARSSHPPPLVGHYQDRWCATLLASRVRVSAAGVVQRLDLLSRRARGRTGAPGRSRRRRKSTGCRRTCPPDHGVAGRGRVEAAGGLTATSGAVDVQPQLALDRVPDAGQVVPLTRVRLRRRERRGRRRSSSRTAGPAPEYCRKNALSRSPSWLTTVWNPPSALSSFTQAVAV